MEEIWKDIPGYEGTYKVSTHGRIFKHAQTQWMEVNKGYRTFKEHFLKGSIGTHGYIEITLSKNGKKEKCLLHRLVLTSFVPNPKNKRTCNHKDGIKTNNYLYNLEWATDSENLLHAYETGLNKMTEERCLHSRGENNVTAKLTQLQVEEIRFMLTFSSLTQKEIAKMYGITQTCVSSIKLRKTWHRYKVLQGWRMEVQP